MITAAQMRAARALLGIDQRRLAALSGLSLPTIQRMEASDGVVRGNVDSLMKLVRRAGRGRHRTDRRGRRQHRRRARRAADRPRSPRRRRMIVALLLCVAALFALALAAVPLAAAPAGRPVVYGGAMAVTAVALLIALAAIGATPSELTLPLGLPWLGAHFRLDALAALLPAGGQPRCRRRQPVRDRLRPARGGAAPGAAVLPGLPRRHESRRARRRRLQLPVRRGS